MTKNNYTEIELQEICEHLNSQEINSSKAERESIKLKQIEYLSDKIGDKFEAVITSIKDWGVYCEIIENKCEGMITSDELTYAGVCINSNEYKIIKQNGETIRLGDVIMIVVKGASMTRKEIEYGLL